jgi:hypothetical protein
LLAGLGVGTLKSKATLYITAAADGHAMQFYGRSGVQSNFREMTVTLVGEES